MNTIMDTSFPACHPVISPFPLNKSQSLSRFLIRNRKGRTPHVVAVTAEPTLSRIASLALGTGDLDCVYHFALFELRDLLEQNDEWADPLEQLDSMIEGKRLKDIADLPLDLAV